MAGAREGSLEAPTRHALDWQNPDFYDEGKLFTEMERVFDICHGCRRCVSLCQSFPVLFDLVDESPTMEVDGVAKEDYWKVVDQCYLCDLCFLTKCPYVPPHEWDLDFPHLMLQAKAVKFKQQGASVRDKTLTSTDRVGSLAGIPVVNGIVNALNRNKTFRGILEDGFGVSRDAKLPRFHSKTLHDRVESFGRFVQYPDRSIAQDGPRQCQSPGLTAGNQASGFADPGVDALRQGFDKIRQPHGRERLPQLGFRSSGPGDQQVVTHTGIEHMRLLGDE